MKLGFHTLLAAFVLVPVLGAAENRLAGEASPYLRMHAQNPVDWYPWGEEAFRRAREENKPVFLSVGYSTCYWCHVMERESFSDPEIAAFMNRWFVNVKVDREERPDVDEVYMTATQLLTRSGGWPNSLFLTPDAEPFYAGTYFPPQDRRGRPGFPRVLRSIQRAWADDPEGVRQTARRVRQGIQRSSAASASAALPDAAELLGRARGALGDSFEPVHGGFSSRIKFPRPTSLEVLLRVQRSDPEARRMLVLTLDQMALGGMYDHLGGGFHRYATEPTWSIPHFEKMLYDNAQLLGLYARAHAETGRPLYRHVAESVAAYLERELLHPEGGFYSAQDAEVDHEEGKSYVWSRDEIVAALGGESAKAFLEVYELAPVREHPGKGVLRVRLPVEPAVAREGVSDVTSLLERHAKVRARLLAVRNQRPQPLRDDKVLTAWNGLTIRGLVDAGVALERPEWIDRAARAARFVLDRLRTLDGRLKRSYVLGRVREQAVLDDYAFVLDGLLALHGATGDPGWLDTSRDLADRMLADYEDPSIGGFYLSRADRDLIVRPKTSDDGSLPSGNGVAVRVLRELTSRTGDPKYEAAARRAVSVFSESLARFPSGSAALVLAMSSEPDASAGPPPTVRAPTRPRLPKSEDQVEISLHRNPEGGLQVEMTIAAGWHLNANPASLPFLVPTSVALDGADSEARVRYPAGSSFQPRFAPEPLQVYEGRIRIDVQPTRRPPGHPSVRVRYQACDEDSCLPPATSTVTSTDP